MVPIWIRRTDNAFAARVVRISPSIGLMLTYMRITRKTYAQLRRGLSNYPPPGHQFSETTTSQFMRRTK